MISNLSATISPEIMGRSSIGHFNPCPEETKKLKPSSTPRMAAPSKLRRAYKRTVALLRTVRDVFPLTLKGALLLCGAGLALARYGLGHVDLLLLVIGGVGLGVGAVALLVVTPAALVLFLSLRRPPEGEPLTLQTGMPMPTGFSLRSVWFVPLLIVEWAWEAPDAEVRTKIEGGRRREW